VRGLRERPNRYERYISVAHRENILYSLPRSDMGYGALTTPP
jgi:hypothetical protein